MNKWEQYIIYGGEMPRIDLPVVKMPEITQEEYNQHDCKEEKCAVCLEYLGEKV